MMDMNRLNDLVAEYKLARLNWDIIKAMDEDIRKKILEENEFYVDPKLASRCGDKSGRRILEPFDDFMISGMDFDKYLDLLYAEYVKAGIADKRGRGYCPDNEARDLFYDAERGLILYAIEEFPSEILIHMNKTRFMENIFRNIKYKKQFLDIIMGLVETNQKQS